MASASQELIDDLAAVWADLANLSGLVVDLAKSQAEATGASASDYWRDAKGVARTGADAVSRRMRDPTPGLTQTVTQDPLPSLLLALAGGFALGMMTARSK